MVSWLKNAIFYEIYPQSFNDTNADGIGDFNGIIDKLDYIKDLGFTAIWMNPCYASPFADAGYDVEDYYTVAPRYGTNEDIKRLFNEVHKRDMHILLDLVPGHTSVECKWFKESMKPEENEYTHRYVWDENIMSNLVPVDGVGGWLIGISPRDGRCAVNFFSSQPALNYGFAEMNAPWQKSVDSPEAMATREEMLNIIRFWLKMGCDGFRVDMAGTLVKNDYDKSATIKLWQELLGKVKMEFPESAFVAEWGDPQKALPAGFDMDFLLHAGPSHYMDLFRTETPYFAADESGSIKDFFEAYMKTLSDTEGRGFICIPSGNHDMVRIAHQLDNTQLKLAYSFLLAMPGVPFIYYGDEIGMRYVEGLTSVEGGYRRTGSRSPMQWNNGVNGGFSTANPSKLYVKMDPNPDRPTVEAQINDPDSLLNHIKRLIEIRKSHTQLQESASFEPIYLGYPLVFRRGNEQGEMLIVINPSLKEKVCEFKEALGEVIYEFGGATTLKDGALNIPPLSACYIKIVK